MLEPRNWRLDVVSKAILACEGFESSMGIDPYMRVRTEAIGRRGQAKLYDLLLGTKSASGFTGFLHRADLSRPSFDCRLRTTRESNCCH